MVEGRKEAAAPALVTTKKCRKNRRFIHTKPALFSGRGHFYIFVLTFILAMYRTLIPPPEVQVCFFSMNGTATGL